MFSIVFGIYFALRKLISEKTRENNSTYREYTDSENSPRGNLNENQRSSIETPKYSKEIEEEIVAKVKDVGLHSKQKVKAEGRGYTKHVQEDNVVKVKDVGLHSKQKVKAEECGYTKHVKEDIVVKVKHNSLHSKQKVQAEGHGYTKHVQEDIAVKVKHNSLPSKQKVQAEGRGYTKHVQAVNVVKVKDVGLHSKQKVAAEGYTEDIEYVNKVQDLSGTLEHEIHGYKDYPYFSDPSTIEFIRHSCTMFLMRGLPGSGKSTIVRYLRKLYPQSVVCSADDFFLGEDGEYRFDQSKLSDAHGECHTKAMVHCENNTPVIIVDNTNVHRWEMAFYLGMANSQHFYHTFIVEPQTPWRHNVNELAKRNKHGISIDLLHKKLDQLKGQKLFPLYYGWFFTKKGSSRIVKMSKEVLSTCVNDLKLTSDKKSTYILKGILEDFDICYTDLKGMLHCTSFFVGSKADHPYHQSKNVQSSVGKVFKLKITGFSYTPRSLSARVNLNGLRDGEKMSSDLAATDLYEKPEEVFLRARFKGHSKVDRALHHFQHGCSAHITLKVSNDLKPKVTGEDILKMCELGFHGNKSVLELSHGFLHCYPDNMFYLQLKEPLMLDTLFHGYYSPARR